MCVTYDTGATRRSGRCTNKDFITSPFRVTFIIQFVSRGYFLFVIFGLQASCWANKVVVLGSDTYILYTRALGCSQVGKTYTVQSFPNNPDIICDDSSTWSRFLCRVWLTLTPNLKLTEPQQLSKKRTWFLSRKLCDPTMKSEMQ